MTFTPLHLGLLLQASAHSLSLRDLTENGGAKLRELQGDNLITGSSDGCPFSITAKGSALIKCLCKYAACEPTYPSGFPPVKAGGLADLSTEAINAPQKVQAQEAGYEYATFMGISHRQGILTIDVVNDQGDEDWIPASSYHGFATQPNKWRVRRKIPVGLRGGSDWERVPDQAVALDLPSDSSHWGQPAEERTAAAQIAQAGKQAIDEFDRRIAEARGRADRRRAEAEFKDRRREEKHDARMERAEDRSLKALDLCADQNALLTEIRDLLAKGVCKGMFGA